MSEICTARRREELLGRPNGPTRQPMMIVGHQPALGQDLAQLWRLKQGNCADPQGRGLVVAHRERDGGQADPGLRCSRPEMA